ncbi:MAG TPA: hypothetical protein DCQ31_02495 [Bacteroidales bacterium]|nr:hypothetical protein [Bacteroidales bacterium]
MLKIVIKKRIPTLIMKKYLFIAILVISVTQYSVAQQNIAISKKEFKTVNEGFAKAYRAITEADDYFADKTKGSYLTALEYYLIANKYNAENAELNYKIGACYLHSISKEKAVLFFEKAYTLKKNVAPDILYLLARSLHLNYKFTEAATNYEKHLQSLDPMEYKLQQKDIEKKIAECNNGIKMVAKPKRIFIDNMGPSINSNYAEHTPVINADASVIYFTSRRENTTGGMIDPYDSDFYEDIYVSTREGKKWMPAKNMGKPVNTKDHDATVGLSNSGNNLFIYQNGDLFESALIGNVWSDPAPFPKVINSSYMESSASPSYNFREIYFVSSRTDNSYGGKDIFKTTRSSAESNRWSDAINLGNTINTNYDEEGAFIHPDGKTLYFSSKGHNSMGGYDIFTTTLQQNGTWSTPENLGYPVNTPDDDVFFVVEASGKYGFYSSVRSDGYGETDIYRITFLGEEKPVVLSTEDNLIASIAQPVKEIVLEEQIGIKTIRLTIVKGKISDYITKKAVGAKIRITDLEKNEVVFESESNSETGTYLLALPSGKNYSFTVTNENYLFFSENFNIPPAAGYLERELQISLLSATPGAVIVLKNIFFEVAKDAINEESYPELDRLHDILLKYPGMKIEISGHTDKTGDAAFNLQLSEARAKKVAEYMIGKGIPAARVIFAGYGSGKPIADNNTETGRQANRRVEFKVIENINR